MELAFEHRGVTVFCNSQAPVETADGEWFYGCLTLPDEGLVPITATSALEVKRQIDDELLSYAARA
jgi:hypothetical protein